MLNDNPVDFGQLMPTKTAFIRETYGIQPELCVTTGVRDMDMRRFTSLQAVEEEPVPANSEQLRHDSIVPQADERDK